MEWESTYEARLLTAYLAGRLLDCGDEAVLSPAATTQSPPLLALSPTPLVVLIKGETQSGKKSLLHHCLQQVDQAAGFPTLLGNTSTPAAAAGAGAGVSPNSSPAMAPSSPLYHLFTPKMADILPRGYLGGCANGLEGYLRQAVATAATMSEEHARTTSSAEAKKVKAAAGMRGVVPLVLLDQIQRWFPLNTNSVLLRRRGAGGGAGDENGENPSSSSAATITDDYWNDAGDDDQNGAGGFLDGDHDDDGVEPTDQVAADLSFFLHLVEQHPLVQQGRVGIICTASIRNSTGAGDQDHDDAEQQQGENDLILVDRWIQPVMDLCVQVEDPTFELRSKYFKDILCRPASAKDTENKSSKFSTSTSRSSESVVALISERAAAKTGGFPRGAVVEVGTNLLRDASSLLASSSLNLKASVDLCVAEVVRRRHQQDRSHEKGGENYSSSVHSSAVVVDVVPTSWSSIVGLEEVKKTIQSKFGFHQKYRHQSAATATTASSSQGEERQKESCGIGSSCSSPFQKIGIPPTTGILLYGPPGTGKTMLAKAVATELHATFLSLSIADLVQGAVGESERLLESLFATAKLRAPSVIFFDELQAAFGRRDGGSANYHFGSNKFGGPSNKNISPSNSHTVSSHDARLTAALIQGLDECRRNYFTSPPVLFIGATNVPQLLEPSLLGPGRLDCLCEVPFPPQEAKRIIIQRELSKLFDRFEHLKKQKKDLSEEKKSRREMGEKDSDLQKGKEEEELIQLLLSKTEPSELPAGSSGCCAADVVNLMNQFGLRVFSTVVSGEKSPTSSATSSPQWSTLMEIATSLRLGGGSAALTA